MNLEKQQIINSTGLNLTVEEIQKILDTTDWTGFWQQVHEKSLPEIEAYRKAEALSRNTNKIFY